MPRSRSPVRVVPTCARPSPTHQSRRGRPGSLAEPQLSAGLAQGSSSLECRAPFGRIRHGQCHLWSRQVVAPLPRSAAYGATRTTRWPCSCHWPKPCRSTHHLGGHLPSVQHQGPASSEEVLSALLQQVGARGALADRCQAGGRGPPNPTPCLSRARQHRAPALSKEDKSLHRPRIICTGESLALTRFSRLLAPSGQETARPAAPSPPHTGCERLPGW